MRLRLSSFVEATGVEPVGSGPNTFPGEPATPELGAGSGMGIPTIDVVHPTPALLARSRPNDGRGGAIYEATKGRSSTWLSGSEPL